MVEQLRVQIVLETKSIKVVMVAPLPIVLPTVVVVVVAALAPQQMEIMRPEAPQMQVEQHQQVEW
jgi:hypothetical protein